VWVKRREVKKEMNLEENSRKLQASKAEANGDSHRISSSRFSSLLASKDRDYLLSQDGTQVHSLISISFFIHL
jgi:nucleoredoxin